MKKLLGLLVILALLSTVVMTAESQAECRATAGTPSYSEGKIVQQTCDLSGNLLTTSSGAGGGDGTIIDGVSAAIKATVFDYTNSNPIAVSIRDANGDIVSITGVANAANPTHAEGAAAGASYDTATGALRVMEVYLRVGDDQTNTQVMTGPGFTKQDVIATAMLVGDDGNFKTSQPGMGGKKSFSLTITGAGAIAQTVKVYGSFESVVDASNGIELCSWTVTGSVKASGACPGVVEAEFPFISAVTSASTGTPSGTLYRGWGN